MTERPCGPQHCLRVFTGGIEHSGRICQRMYQELEVASLSRFDCLVNIGIDETSYKKGHKYMTVVIGHQPRHG